MWERIPSHRTYGNKEKIKSLKLGLHGNTLHDTSHVMQPLCHKHSLFRQWDMACNRFVAFKICAAMQTHFSFLKGLYVIMFFITQNIGICFLNSNHNFRSFLLYKNIMCKRGFINLQKYCWVQIQLKERKKSDLRNKMRQIDR